MGKKKISPETQVAEYAKEIVETIEKWKSHAENGCSDPLWSDGVNMNLLRNHVIYYKRQILSLCEQENIPQPEELSLPVPPKVDNYYMACAGNKERLRRISSRERIVTKRPKYNEDQLELTIF